MMSQKKAAVAISVLLAAGMIAYYFRIFQPRVRAVRTSLNIAFFCGEDLYPYWLGTREFLMHGVSPYSEKVTHQIQEAVYGRTLNAGNPFERDQHRFVYPLYLVLLMAPFAWLPFPVLRVGAAVFLPLLALGGILMWNRSFHLNLSRAQLAIIAVLALSSYSLLAGLFAQQLTFLVFFAVAASIWFLSRRMFVPAGISLAISTIKPQLVLPAILFLLLWSLSGWGERRNLPISFSVAMGVLIAASVWLMPMWPTEWLHMLHDYRQYTVPPLAPYILGQIAGNILRLLLFAVSGWLWWKFRKEDAESQGFALALAFTLTTAVVAIPMGDAVYDHIFILPGILLLISNWRNLLRWGSVPRFILLVTAALFAWPWVAGAIVAAADWLWPNLVRSPFILSSPLRTQPSMPFAILALLGLRITGLLSGKENGGARRTHYYARTASS